MTRFLFTSVVLLTLGACGRSEAEGAVAATLPHPQAARFQSVTQYDDGVCGEVSGGGASRGGYVRFVFRDSAVSISPRTFYTAADLASFDATCRTLGGQGNGLDREVCTRAAQIRQDAALSADFEALWQRTCR